MYSQGAFPYKKPTGVLVAPFDLGVKTADLVPLWLFSLKRSPTGALEVTFRVLSRKNVTGDNVTKKIIEATPIKLELGTSY